jgi:iron complex outermembrane receptor protein
MGNLGFYQIDSALSVPLIEDKLAIRVAGEELYRNGIGRNAINQRLGAQNNKTGRVSLLFQPSDRIKLFATGDYTHATSTGSVIDATFLDPLQFNASGQPISSYASSLPAVLRDVATELGLPLTQAGYTLAYNSLKDELFNKNGFYHTNGTYPVSSRLELYGGSADLSVDVSDGITLRSITGYRGTRRNDFQDYDQTQFAISKPENYVYSHQLTEEFQVVHNGGGRLTWIAGFFYSHEAGREGSVAVALAPISTASPSTTDYNVVNNSYAGFAQANYAITDKLKLTGGIRYSKITQDVTLRNHNPLGCLVPVQARPDPAVCSADFGTGSKKPSYLASLEYHATPDIMVYAKTSSSFRGGGINVRGASATSTAPFAPFGPEQATDYEIGFKGELFDRHLRINAAGYYTDYTGIQRSTLSPGINNTLITILTSSAKGRIYGGELELTYRPTRALELNAAGNLTHTEYTKFTDAAGNDRSNEPFPVPKLQYTVSGKYTLPVAAHNLSLFISYNWQAKVNYVGAAIFDESVTQKSYGLLDGRLAYDIGGSPKFEVALFGKNLLNKHYYTNALNFDNSLGFNVAFAGDPRTFGVELRVALGGG